MKSEHATPPDDRNQRLLNQYMEIAQLTGVLAHELKNPLSTILLNMELLAEDLAEDTSPRGRRARGKVVVMERECGRLQSLLDDFLNFVKLRGARLEPSDLNELVTGVLDFFAPSLAEAGVEALRYLDPELPSVMLERESFRRAVMNLVLNAQQSMPQGGQLLVRTRSAGNLVALDLID